MDNFWDVVDVLDWTKQLLEVVPWKPFTETSLCILYFDVREQISLLDQLKYDEVYLDGFSFLFNYFTIDVVFDKSDNVLMVHLLE